MSWDHVSASQIETFLSCNRKWWLDKIGEGVRTESASQALGKAVHANIESHLLNGTPLDHPLLTFDTFIAEVKGRVGVELLIEHEFRLPGIKDSVGFIDLVIVDHEVKHVEIWDHKTTKDWKYARTADELRSNAQGRVYVLAMYEKYGSTYTYSFGHHVILTARAAPARTTRVEFSQSMIEQARSVIDMTMNSMVSASTVVDGRDVVPNTSECWKYGGCPYRTKCKGDEPMPSLAELAAQTQPGPAYPQTIYIDCINLKVPYVSFSDWTRDLEATFKQEVGRDAVALKYAEGVIAIATKARDTLPAPSVLFIRTSDAAAMKYLDLVEAFVPNIIQSIR